VLGADSSPLVVSTIASGGSSPASVRDVPNHGHQRLWLSLAIPNHGRRRLYGHRCSIRTNGCVLSIVCDPTSLTSDRFAANRRGRPR